MNRKVIFAIVCVVVALLAGYVSLSKWGIRHETLSLYDATRGRAVAVDLAVRRDYEMRAYAGYRTLPVAIISHGNTVKNTEYSFIANVLAARGYLVASIQHDLPSDAPLVTKQGSLYVGRLANYERAEQNIIFAIGELKKIQPNADYDHLTLVGHSNGGDISMYFCDEHPLMVSRVITLDNLRVPLLAQGATKILSFRSHDTQFKPDPGVVPTLVNPNIDIVRTQAQHNDLSDRGPENVKESIEGALDQFLDTQSSDLKPADGEKLIVTIPKSDLKAMGP
jgi:pimeloyl-ACP methyl ester carboxylesterase